ncbi:penicillin-binding transpeptidase domain-containing protein [Nocardioides limicola]|uniref:penicillin-binding transpeptidase domain-containing protein n=1 Tax=Nocardioides limicola TaxID=2803368 RepID=UPI00193AE047|nr:penicillin-binding transpeptidase domain-containing protein [Nocardioides sp. DJM-14]
MPSRLGSLALLTALITSSCALWGSDPLEGAEDAATRLVAALEGGDLAEYGADADTSYAEITDGLGDPEVSLGELRLDADETPVVAVAELRWRWALTEDETWSYTTNAHLESVASDDGGLWRLQWDPSVVEPSLVEGERLRLRTVAPRRGDILGARDEPLVTLRDVVRFGVDKSRGDLTQAIEAARHVADTVGVDRRAYVSRVRAAGERAFVEAVTLRADDAAPLLADGSYDEVPGAAALGTRIPLAPTRTFAAPILGRFGEATAEMIEQSDGELQPGDRVGLSGLQARYQEHLAGNPGLVVEAVAVDATARELHTVEVEHGRALRTTMDLDLQELAEELLGDVAPASALVAVRPSDGHLVAVASGPGSAGYSTATLGQYPPGSTFKTVTALALLRSGLTADSALDCAAVQVVDGRRFTNYSDYPSGQLGRIDLARAVAHSCNTAFMAARDRIEPTQLSQAAAALGLGVDQSVGFPAYFGSVPEPASETGWAASLIGQGQVLASPLAMAAVMASVVRGETVTPTLVLDHDTAPTRPEQPLTQAEAEALQALLRGVVSDGTGRFLAGLPGPPALAKTGTAEQDQSDAAAWMIGAQGDLAVAVLVAEGESGSRTAGPILAEFLRRAR